MLYCFRKHARDYIVDTVVATYSLWQATSMFQLMLFSKVQVFLENLILVWASHSGSSEGHSLIY